MNPVAFKMYMRFGPRGALWTDRVLLGFLGIGMAAVTAYLVTAGLWPVALALFMVLPGFLLVHRAPLAAVVIWLLLVPLTLDTGTAGRLAFWGLHRAIPIGVVMLLVIAGMLGTRDQTQIELGWPEAMMVGYLVASLISIGYAADAVPTEVIRLYDSVAVPMTLYLLIRVSRPSRGWFHYLVPVAAATVVLQTIIGALSWGAPGLLPSGWLSRAGSRTTGSLGSPSVYGVVLIGAGLLLLHAAAYERRPDVRHLYRLLFLLSLIMAVLTFTRAVWLAVIIAAIAAGYTYPRQVRRLAVVAIPLVAILILTGTAGRQIETIETRLASEDTALSRLPVVYASIEMFEARPITGWGYGNFDKFDRQFQRQVNGFFPEKDQASHNLYLTLAAEQGTIGLVLYIGPAIWWLVKSRKAYSSLPESGLVSQKLLILLWTILACHVVVNNFSNMKVVVGLGHWWLTLGFIAAVVSSQDDKRDHREAIASLSKAR